VKVGIIDVRVASFKIKHGFEKLGHKLSAHDLKLKTSILDVINSGIVFISTSTLSTQ